MLSLIHQVTSSQLTTPYLLTIFLTLHSLSTLHHVTVASTAQTLKPFSPFIFFSSFLFHLPPSIHLISFIDSGIQFSSRTHFTDGHCDRDRDMSCRTNSPPPNELDSPSPSVLHCNTLLHMVCTRVCVYVWCRPPNPNPYSNFISISIVSVSFTYSLTKCNSIHVSAVTNYATLHYAAYLPTYVVLCCVDRLAL